MSLSGRQRVAITLGAVVLTAAVVVGAQRGAQWLSGNREATSGAMEPDLRSPSERQISALQSRLQQTPDDDLLLAQLGQAYLQKARESGDPAYYPRAEETLQKSLALQPKNFTAMVGLGSLALSRHQFQEALEWGEKARAIAPKSTGVLAVIADAQIELGQYDRAVTTIQALVDLRPDQSSYARVSYARELHGHLPEAIESMKQAVQAGAPGLEPTAWTHVQLGHLYFNTGDLTAAQLEYQRALKEVPDYLHALAGLARVEAARGHYPQAIDLYTRATTTVPMAEYVIALGDVYRANGQEAEAQQQYKLVDAIKQLNQASGVDMDLELAVFELDHDRDLAQTLEVVRAQAAKRPSIKTQDTLAWALYKNRDCQGAQQAMQQALRLGTQDALMFFHAGLIAECLGQKQEARTYLERAVKLNPHFSLLHAPRAQEALASLQNAGAGVAIGSGA
jgi:tetratricopeptide (TPR) repeat protein